VRRLSDAQIGRSGTLTATDADYVEPGVLCAFDPGSAKDRGSTGARPAADPGVVWGDDAMNGAVVLVDEVDKADPDFPNALLEPAQPQPLHSRGHRRHCGPTGTRPLDQITASDIEAMQHRMAATARSRRNSRHGRHAGEHVIAAARAIYTRAIADGHITATQPRAPRCRTVPTTQHPAAP
jgi:hypothetical protein